jgi:hypothetical protein
MKQEEPIIMADKRAAAKGRAQMKYEEQQINSMPQLLGVHAPERCKKG